MDSMEVNGTSNMTSSFNFVNPTNTAEDEGRDVKTLAMSYVIFKIGKYSDSKIDKIGHKFKHVLCVYISTK